MSRLRADLWVGAYLARLGQAAIPAYVVRRGAAEAGAIIIKLATLDGQARAFQGAPEGAGWMVLAEGGEAEVDAALARARARDPDLWIIEVEDRAGRHLLDDMPPR
mgnify:CR=1 FL=1